MDIAPISECGAMVAGTESILHKLFAVTEGHPQQHRNWSRGTGGGPSVCCVPPASAWNRNRNRQTLGRSVSFKYPFQQAANIRNFHWFTQQKCLTDIQLCSVLQPEGMAV